MISIKRVTPTEAGVQTECNYIRILDARFHGNDPKEDF
jgi:hypothetical protein